MKKITIAMISLLILSGLLTIYPGSSTVTATEGTLADGMTLEVRNPLFLEIILRWNAFTPILTNDNIITVSYRKITEITGRGRQLFYSDCFFTGNIALKPGASYWDCTYQFDRFREKRFMFGIFHVDIWIHVFEDGSERCWEFNGIIFGISARVFFNPN